MKAIIMFLLLSGVVLGQVDTSKLHRWTSVYKVMEKDTIQSELMVAEFVDGKKTLILIDGYIVRDIWMASEPIYLDANKKRLGRKVYMSFLGG